MAGSNQPLSFVFPSNALDKIFFSEPGTIAVTQNASALAPVFTTVTIPQTAGSTIFVDAQLSPDNVTWYDVGYEPQYFNVTFMTWVKRFYVQQTVTSTDVVLNFTANDASYTFYYRTVGYYK